MDKTTCKQVEAVKKALHAANHCLMENGDGPAPLGLKQIEHIAEPLLDDLIEAGFTPPSE